MESHELKDLLEKYERGKCSPDEERLVDKWYQNVTVEQKKPVDENRLEEKLWTTLKPDSSSPKPFYYRVAAVISFLIVAGSVYFFTHQWDFSLPGKPEMTAQPTDLEHYANTTENVITVALRDGSNVTLQPGSKLSYSSTSFNTDKREVFLSGQGFFDVKKDPSRPFLVHSKDVTTRVLGTSFCVKAYDSDHEITVSVKTGKVSVYTENENQNKYGQPLKETILTPNQRLVYNTDARKAQKGIIQKPAIVLAQPTLFTMKYDGAPVTKLLEVLEENYGIEIRYDEKILGECILTTSMTEEGFYERIEILCKAINAKYEVVDGAVVITSEGCN